MAVRPKTRPDTETNQENPFECHICLKSFVNPRLLPNCWHSVCGPPRQCLNDILTAKIKSCRVCGKLISVPSLDIENFPENVSLNRAVKCTEANKANVKMVGPVLSSANKQHTVKKDSQKGTARPNQNNVNNNNFNNGMNGSNNNDICNNNANNRRHDNPYPMCEKHPGQPKSKICSRCRVSICDGCWRQDHRDKRRHKIELFEDYRDKAVAHEKKVPQNVNLNVVKNFDKVFRQQKQMFERVEHFSHQLTQQREREMALKEQLNYVTTAEELYDVRLRLRESRNEQPRLVNQMEDCYARVNKSLNRASPFFDEMTRNVTYPAENSLFLSADHGRNGVNNSDNSSGEIGSPF